MAERSIPLVQLRQRLDEIPGAGAAAPLPAALTDTRGRLLHDLRISVTDRCNFRCTYCMPKTVFGRDYPFLPRAEILSFDEIVRVARIFQGLGVRKLRLTGGEPLLRRNIEHLMRCWRKFPSWS